ncbi:YhcN/YlaJ family sporulation lipoprotein [Paenibacillus sp. sptzw28]|uniref:YhcN/YlaJ family sporulation lipoprotein n=1 Tax=Paenibacillus sp. sptzw28 TaxID=715179 RepID=UPI001C6EB464|nr:YhcN/YlaJ family sporulation lipoprotein [Paenibacillus sp. sptzw28]QYR19489.1 YhcN/YlaJ family sporulation lipoprotein [Paenibacillus sp. sptzw28]
MRRKKYSLLGAVMLIAAVSVISTGCMNNNPDNQMRTRQAQNQAQNQGQNQAQNQGQNQAQNQGQTNLNERIQVADKAADSIVRIRGVRQANVLVTNRNAYVAALIDTKKGRFNAAMEADIARQVRATDPNIDNVYVSTNPEFIDRVNAYVMDVRQGRPVTGFFKEFNLMVQKMFPTRR